MKKIIALLVIMLAFGLNANAQQKRTIKAAAQETSPYSKEVQQAALKDLNAMKQVVALDENASANFAQLFEHKHDILRNNISDERKKVLAQSIEAKIKASLTPEQVGKLEKKPELMHQLTH